MIRICGPGSNNWGFLAGAARSWSVTRVRGCDAVYGLPPSLPGPLGRCAHSFLTTVVVLGGRRGCEVFPPLLRGPDRAGATEIQQRHATFEAQFQFRHPAKLKIMVDSHDSIHFQPGTELIVDRNRAEMAHESEATVDRFAKDLSVFV